MLTALLFAAVTTIASTNLNSTTALIPTTTTFFLLNSTTVASSNSFPSTTSVSTHLSASTPAPTLLPLSTSTKDPADQAVEDILSLNTTDTEDIDYDQFNFNDTVVEIPMPTPDQLRDMNVTFLEKYRESLERLLERVEEELARSQTQDEKAPVRAAAPVPVSDSDTTLSLPTHSTSSTHQPGGSQGQVEEEQEGQEGDGLRVELEGFASPAPFRDLVTFPVQGHAFAPYSTALPSSVSPPVSSTPSPTTIPLSPPTSPAPPILAHNGTIGNGTEDDEPDFTTDTVFVPVNTTHSSNSTSTLATPAFYPRRTVFKLTKRLKKQKKRIVTHRRGCTKHTQEELVEKLKDQGTYNPDYMAWDVPGVIRFLDAASPLSAYDRIPEWELKDRPSAAVERNLGALERILRELGLSDECDVRGPDTLARLYNITHSQTKPENQSHVKDRLRFRRSGGVESKAAARRRLFANSLFAANATKEGESGEWGRRMRDSVGAKGVIGQVHTVPFGCSQRGSEEEGFLRLCGVCQAIRRLPDTFFPPFINEALCDEDKACLYFYDYPHGKCKQKQMNFVVLRNVGTQACELWRRFNLNVRVSCECFVDRMSFFAKYV